MRLIISVALVLLAAAGPAAAEPRRYVLETDKSVVGFSWFLGEAEVKGTMPVASAELMIDPLAPEASRVSVAVDVAGARAGFPFATQAMKGPKVLDAARHPRIRFASRRIGAAADGAVVEGDLTVRGVTRPVVFDVGLYRQRGTAEGDLSRLSVIVTGSLSRAAYGADGWSDLAGDEVRLTIVARMALTE